MCRERKIHLSFNNYLISFIAPGIGSMGGGTGDGMGGASVGCLLDEEKAAEEAEEKGMVPLWQPFRALSRCQH